MKILFVFWIWLYLIVDWCHTHHLQYPVHILQLLIGITIITTEQRIIAFTADITATGVHIAQRCTCTSSPRYFACIRTWASPETLSWCWSMAVKWPFLGQKRMFQPLLNLFISDKWAAMPLQPFCTGMLHPRVVCRTCAHFMMLILFLDVQTFWWHESVRYRYYDGVPLWPFRWGISYTSFELGWHLARPMVTTTKEQQGSLKKSWKRMVVMLVLALFLRWWQQTPGKVTR